MHLGCYNKSALDWVTYKPKRFTCHNSGGWQAHDQGAGSIWQISLPGSYMAPSAATPCGGGTDEAVSGASFFDALFFHFEKRKDSLVIMKLVS